MSVTVRDRDFSKGAIWRLTLSQALPLMLAQLVQLLYNVVDRIYIGHMDGGDSIALTGVGLTFPVITFIVAFAALFGMGGVPLFSMANGSGDKSRAEKIMGCSCFMLLAGAAVLTVSGYLFCRPILYLLGASDSSYPYAADYLRIYMAGTVFSMLTTGLNSYISAQGFPKTGMFTTIIGAVLNMLLDPLFIFVFGLGIKGAALATVISQIVSAVWIMRFLVLKAPIGLKRQNIRFDSILAGNICKLGTSNFVMQGTACFVQAACNSTLQTYGGDLYVGIMTVLNSVRDVFFLPISGLVNGSQPIMGYNYGAKKYDRVKQSIRFNTLAGAVYTVSAWLLIVIFPQFWFRIFSSDSAILGPGVDAIKLYFFGFVFMSFQFAGQSTFQALGAAGRAIFFSLLRKVIIVIPLTLILPRLGMGVKGVFIAEPISNMVGGLASYITMRLTVYNKLNDDSKE
ncbi:MAG: MATE family efflux transporter [Ruminococcus sp.]|nr:MATE family efflux transporter [Ruminococcus sp.]MBR0528269.1 MATE family efflux transporter [Ruminococcus sp.]